ALSCLDRAPHCPRRNLCAALVGDVTYAGGASGAADFHGIFRTAAQILVRAAALIGNLADARLAVGAADLEFGFWTAADIVCRAARLRDVAPTATDARLVVTAAVISAGVRARACAQG